MNHEKKNLQLKMITTKNQLSQKNKEIVLPSDLFKI